MNFLIEIYNAIVKQATERGEPDPHRQAADAVEHIMEIEEKMEAAK